MAKFLFTVWPFAGHLHPSLAIAHALRGRGHEVAFYTGGSVSSAIQAEGFRCFPFRHVSEERIQALASSEIPYCPTRWDRIRNAKLLQAKFREWLLDTVPQQVLDIEDAMQHWGPDVLVCDLAFWSPILVLHESRHMPVAVLSILAACLLPGPDVPVWGEGKPRPRSAVARSFSQVEQTLLRWLSAGFRGQVNEMRSRFGLPAIDCPVTEFAGRMPLYLVPSTPEYDYRRRDLPSSVRYVGPCLWDKPSQAPAPHWLSPMAAAAPLIYVTEATVGTQEPFLLKAAMQAFRDAPFGVVMTTGKQRDPEKLDLGPAASNIRIEAYVPQSDLLPRVSVMVTLGGSGGVLAALKAGVPLVIVPTEWDRPENAQRVVEAGAGLRIAPTECTPERLRAAVERVMQDPRFRQNAQRLAGDFAKFEGPNAAAKALEGLVPTAAGVDPRRQEVPQGVGR